MPDYREEWLQENVNVLARHDKKLHDLEIQIINLAAETKVIKTIVIFVMGAAGFAATVIGIVKAVG